MPLPLLALLATLLAAPAELGWQTVEECPGELELEERIAGWIGPSEPGSADVHAEGRIRATEAGYRLDLVIALGPREQSHVLHGHDCAELTDLAAMLIASAIDPFVLDASGAIDGFGPIDAIVVVPVAMPVPEPEPAIESEPEPEPTIPDPTTIPVESEPEPSSERAPEFGPLTAAADEPPRRARIEGFLSASGMGFAGLFQRPSGGVELLGGFDRGALRVAVGAAGWFGGRFRSADEGVGGNLRAGSGVLEVCGVPTVRRGTVGFPLCAVAAAGAIVGTGVGVPAPATVVRPWAAAGGEVGLRVRVHRRVALRLHVGVLASLVRPVWEVAGPVVSFTTPPVMGRAGLALDVFLGPR